MPPPLSRNSRLAVGFVVVVVVAATAWIVLMGRDGVEGSSKDPDLHADGRLDPGFHAPPVDAHFSGQVVEPEPETWTDVRPSSEYRVLVLADGRDERTARDPQVAILVDAVQRWAREEDRVELTIDYLTDPHAYIDAIDRAAIADEADLIVTAGNQLVDPVAVVSANYAGEEPQQFLVLGAEVAEPTHNIAASDWQGSAYLGEGVRESDYYDPAAVTGPRAYAALRAGVAAVLSGYGGVIVRIPADHY